MLEFIAKNEPALRLGIFLGIFMSMAVWEWRWPMRQLKHSKLLRWTNNIGIAALNTVILRLLLPAAIVGVAAYAQSRGIGLFNILDLPLWLAILATVLLLDLAIYGQHVLVHKIPILWRLHLMHHADLDFDVTTAVRFHPLEILLSAGIKIGLVLLLGAHPVAVVIFEVLLSGTALFNHSNARIPGKIDQLLRLILVTPDMHRVHHSIIPMETNSNFGFNLPWWDRIFGTYRAQPEQGHLDMTIGIEAFREDRELWMDRLLAQPLRKTK
jgi:sterol desaturase/sphingolipid hydroxylase (fatty acid hydroxylase superfamily)